jgi:hypothetical protein
MKKLFPLFFLFSIVSCKTDPSEKTDTKPVIEKPIDKTISINFRENEFSSNLEKELLKEIKICNPNELDDSDSKKCACSAKFFKFFPLSKSISLSNGFVLVIKSEFCGFPIRRTIVFERENGTLVKVNGFNANLIEQRESTSGYNDLILRFPDRIDKDVARLTYYNCKYSWKNGQYQMTKVEEIDEDFPRKIKQEYQDSMNKVILSILEKNNMFI